MADYKYSTPKKLMEAICDAVRRKNGTNDIIPHQDIPEQIDAIGGSGVKNLLKGTTWVKGFISASGELTTEGGSGKPITSDMLEVEAGKFVLTMLTERPANSEQYWLCVSEFYANGTFKRRTSTDNPIARSCIFDVTSPLIRVSFRSFGQDNDISLYRGEDLDYVTVEYV